MKLSELLDEVLGESDEFRSLGRIQRAVVRQQIKKMLGSEDVELSNDEVIGARKQLTLAVSMLQPSQTE